MFWGIKRINVLDIYSTEIKYLYNRLLRNISSAALYILGNRVEPKNASFKMKQHDSHVFHVISFFFFLLFVFFYSDPLQHFASLNTNTSFKLVWYLWYISRAVVHFLKNGIKPVLISEIFS